MKLPKTQDGAFDFLEFAELETLLEAIAEPETLAMVLLGAEAGLRNGEARALKWTDVNLVRLQLTVSRRLYKGHMDTPKGGRPRTIPMTQRLATALRDHRHAGPWVLTKHTGRWFRQDDLNDLLRAECRAAELPREITYHALRHTFCSHLAMRGVAGRLIQELAGHANLVTTQRYMHLAPDQARRGIDALERRDNDVPTAKSA